MFINPV